jgi:hypothetical protein
VQTLTNHAEQLSALGITQLRHGESFRNICSQQTALQSPPQLTQHIYRLVRLSVRFRQPPPWNFWLDTTQQELEHLKAAAANPFQAVPLGIQVREA